MIVIPLVVQSLAKLFTSIASYQCGISGRLYNHKAGQKCRRICQLNTCSFMKYSFPIAEYLFDIL